MSAGDSAVSAANGPATLRIAAVSDIHGNLPALEAVVADIRRRGVDTVVNLGDSLSGPLMPLQTAQYLMATDWLHLAGNHERQILAVDGRPRIPSDAYAYAQLGEVELDWIRSLRHCHAFDDDLLLCHGTPQHDNHYFLESVDGGRTRPAHADEIEARLGPVSHAAVLCGHTHVPRIMASRFGIHLVNPGSVGLQAYADDHPHPHVVENGSPAARYALIERHGEQWSFDLIAVPYDHHEMARLAAANGRPDWADALATGRMP